ncbi:MAG: TIR domain-containing protein [Lachnospiraceae bacterium]|nr:TIR domain-containing protein [Lachnospiraceae bacterium]
MNELKEVHYDAFISYRHSDLDSFVAEHLHKKLESFKLPRTLHERSKSGKTGIKRVFRDVDELPLSENLSEPINNAIANSDYLITICTPRYPESRWCMKEIELFLKSHDRSHILVVLADGEPAEAFPEILTYDEVEIKEEDGKVRVERRELEPLAADTRGENRKEILKAMDTAVVKLCAAMFGLNYDDLRQRHREAKMRKLMTVFGVAAAAFLTFALVVTGMLFKISDQNSLITEQYAELQDRFAAQVADEAEVMMQDGRTRDAVYALRNALPDDDTGAYNANAVRTMYKALNVYGVDHGFSSDVSVDLGAALTESFLSPDGKYILLQNTDRARIFRTSTGELLEEFTCNSDVYGITAAFCGKDGVIVLDADRSGYFSLSGGQAHTAKELGLTEEALLFADPDGKLTLASQSGEILAIEAGGKVAYRIKAEDLSENVKPGYAWIQFGGDYVSADLYAEDGASAGSVVLEKESGKILRFTGLERCYSLDTRWAGGRLYLIFSNFNQEGTFSARIRAVKAETGEKLWETEFPSSVIDIVGQGDDVIILGWGEALVVNQHNGKEVCREKLKGDVFGAMNYKGKAYIFCANGSVYTYTDEGFRDSWDKLFLTGLPDGVRSMIMSGETIALFTEDASFALIYHDQAGVNGELIEEEEAFDYYYDLYSYEYLEDDQIPESVNRDQLYYAFYSVDGRFIVAIYSNKLYQILDAETGVVLRSVNSDESVSSLWYCELCDSYVMNSDVSSQILDEDLRPICEMNRIVGEHDGKLLLMAEKTDGETYEFEYYLVPYVSYNELIKRADEYLGDYEPSEEIREKYNIN